MSTAGVWGYVGIVLSVGMLLALFLWAMEMIYRVAKDHGKGQAVGEPQDQTSAGTRRAA